MALLPDFGTWLLRSVRRSDSPADSPVSVVEQLNSLPRPLRNADKDTLLGAVLSLAPSLQLALHMLVELLPEDDSRERLGEVLCPTLGQLQKSLDETLACFAPKPLITFHAPEKKQRRKTPPPDHFFTTTRLQPQSSSDVSQMKAGRKPIIRPLTPIRSPSPSEQQEKPQTIYSSPHRIGAEDLTLVETFPSYQEGNEIVISRPQTSNAKALHSQDLTANKDHPDMPLDRPPTSRSNPAADLALMKELRAEMRVNAAIQVAVDSLEFVDGQMKIVRDIHRLHGGGSFELLQKHFYEGYNRILFRALELEQREFDSPDASPAGSVLGTPERLNGEWAGQGDVMHEHLPFDVSPIPQKLQEQYESEGSAGSPRRRPQRLSITQTPGPNVTPEHINTHRDIQHGHQRLQPPPRLVSFGSSEGAAPMALPPLPPPSYSQSIQVAGSSSPTRPKTAVTGMRMRWEDQEPGHGHGQGVNGVNGYHERRPLARRNTVHGQSTDIAPKEPASVTRPKPTLRRRLSLAEELALVGEESEEETDADVGNHVGGWDGAADQETGGSSSDSSEKGIEDSSAAEDSSEEEDEEEEGSDSDDAEPEVEVDSEEDESSGGSEDEVAKSVGVVKTGTGGHRLGSNGSPFVPRASTDSHTAKVEANRKSQPLVNSSSRLPRPQTPRAVSGR